jgi:serine protease Do
MDSIPPSPPPERSPMRLSSRLPILIGILLALLVLLYLPTYLQHLEYAKMRGEVQAIDESLGGDLGQKFGSLGKAFVVIAQKEMPSVVHIDTRQRAVRRVNDIFSGIVPEMEGEASGVIVDPSGFIITNNHVVRGAEEIKVTLSNGKSYDAEVLNTDESFDLALVKINAKDLVAADWGDSDQLDVGEMVLAIGNPYGLDRSVTFGIVSGKNRHNDENESDFLQTDAAVNPGNSGGPLVNMAGNIVGINTAIVGEQYQGISLAIPSNTARKIYEQLKSGHATESGFLGVNIGRITPQLARQLGLRTTRGALVMGVVPKSPAERAGIQVGDVITSWGDREIDDRNLLILLIARTKIGTPVPVSINRNGETIKLDVTVTARPKQLSSQPRDE